MNNVYTDSDYMTFKDFLARLRKDIDDPDFFAFDLKVPENEEQYQDMLKMCKYLKGNN